MPAQIWLTPPQVAKQLHRDYDSVMKWIASGELSAVNMALNPKGRPRWKVSQEDIDAFLDKRRNKAPVPRKPRGTPAYMVGVPLLY